MNLKIQVRRTISTIMFPVFTAREVSFRVAQPEAARRFTYRCTAAWWRLPPHLRSLRPLVVRSS